MLKKKPELKQIPIEYLYRGKYQPRRQFNEEALQELADSIKSAGIIQPIVVRPDDNNRYEIIAGERRWRASQMAGLQQVSCLVNSYTDEQMAAITTIENINRVDLNPVEEAQAYQRLIDDFQYLHEEVAAAVGKSRAKISNALRLLKLEPQIQAFLIDGSLSEGHGKVLAGCKAALQIELAKRCIARAWSVRKLEQEARKLLLQDEQGDGSPSDPNLKHLENALSQHIGCKVGIDFNVNDAKGQVTIDFHNLDILEGIFNKMGFEVS